MASRSRISARTATLGGRYWSVCTKRCVQTASSLGLCEVDAQTPGQLFIIR
jgi:hypothetical protein